MKINFDELKPVKDNKSFTDDDYMNPSTTFEKYKNRDREEGIHEAKKRKLIFDQLLQISNEFAKNSNIDAPVLMIKGSTAVDMCQADSDLDIAVIVKLGHEFIRNHKLWSEYEKKLVTSLKTDFKITPRLIIEGVIDTTSFLLGI